MAILESIQYQLLILKHWDTEPMQWEKRSEHKGLLDINTTEKWRKHTSPKHRNIPDIKTIKNKCNKADINIKENSNSKKQTSAQHISWKQVYDVRPMWLFPWDTKITVQHETVLQPLLVVMNFEYSRNHYPKSDPNHHTDLVIKIMKTFNIIALRW